MAATQPTTLYAAFREWLAHFVASSGDERRFGRLMKRMKHIDAGQHFSRDEMKER
jgi:hypothetical protein